MKKKRFKLSPSWRKFVALIYALAPFLGYYDVPFIRKNLFVVLVLLISLFTVFPVLVKEGWSYKKGNNVLDILLPMMGLVFITGIIRPFLTGINMTSGQIYYFFLFFGTLVFSSVLFMDEKLRNLFRKYVEGITIFMSICVVVQCVMHYILNMQVEVTWAMHLPFREMMDTEIAGDIEIRAMEMYNHLFRPRAFFIEPANFAQYCSIGLVSILTQKKKYRMKAIIVTFAMIMTTSGIGIFSVILIWGGAFLLSGKGIKKKTLFGIMALAAIGIPATLYAYFRIEFLHNAVDRMLFSYNGYNSVEGRLGTWRFVRELSGIKYVIGNGYRNFPTFIRNGVVVNYYMTAITELFYCQGILGGILFCMLCVALMKKIWNRRDKSCILMVYIAIIYIIGSNLFVPYRAVLYVPFLFYLAEKDDNKENEFIDMIKGNLYEKDRINNILER